MTKAKWTLETTAVQAGNRQGAHGAIAMPITLASNYRHASLAAARDFSPAAGYSYARLATPTRRVLEQNLARLEAGQQAFALSSGMAAVQLALSFLRSGDEIVALDDLYGGVFRYFGYLAEHAGIHWTTWDGHATAELVAQLTPHTKVVWLESPSNPLMKQVDIAAVARAVHQFDPAIRVMVDNTFLTPVYQQPLTLGADVVVHSATKYLSGHNDLLGGAVIVKDEVLAAIYYDYYLMTGDTLASFDAWLLLRSLKTLPVRMKQHTANARYLAAHLPELPGVAKVSYPGVGGMVSLTMASAALAEQVLDHLQLISFAESLGGVESLITIPYYQTHADVPVETRLALGITPCLLRLSVGLEDPADLLADFKQALAPGDEP